MALIAMHHLLDHAAENGYGVTAEGAPGTPLEMRRRSWLGTQAAHLTERNTLTG
jgi:hypothetical protein